MRAPGSPTSCKILCDFDLKNFNLEDFNLAQEAGQAIRHEVVPRRVLNDGLGAG
jgi:hypothetical protein